MIEALDRIRPTALPALLFLVWLPLFLLLPTRYSKTFFIITGIATLALVGGPALAGGLLAAILLGYVLVEGVAGLRVGRRAAFVTAIVVLHLCYFACFHLPLPRAFQFPHLRVADGPGVFVFFSGIALTFLRLMSYAADRIRGDAPRISPGDYLAYMLFFPQFRHGPVERGHDFAPKLQQARQRWSRRDLRLGLFRTGVGVGGLLAAAALAALFSHMLPERFRADPLALFSKPEALSPPQLLLLIHLPALFFYLLESGFAHLQLGVSRVYGIRGSDNFRHPFLARDPRELWHRWNITFSSWLRDYVYIPLGGNRHHKYLNVFLVFVYCSLLHGFQPRCLAWGLWTGGTLALYLCASDTLARRPKRGTALRRSAVLRVSAAILSRLATFHWFCIGVTILIDPQHCGLRVLRQYVHMIAGCFSR